MTSVAESSSVFFAVDDIRLVAIEPPRFRGFRRILIRDGKPQTLKVVVTEKAASTAIVVSALGFDVTEAPARAGPDSKPSVVVSTVVRGSPAERRGLFPGLKIVAVGRTEVHSKNEFDRAASSSSFSVDQGLPLLVVFPSGQSAYLTIGGTR